MNCVTWSRSLTVLAVAAILSSYSPGRSQAQVYTWNVANGAFDNPLNWNPNGVPEIFDVVRINNGGTATFNTSPTLSVNSLEIASASGTSGTLAVTGGDLFGAGIRIGEGGTGTATVNNGMLRAAGSGSLFVGGQDGTGVGTLTVSGGASTLVSSDDDIGVGRFGTGTVNVNGGEVKGVYTFIGKYGTGTWNQAGGLFRQTGGDVEIGDGGRPDQSGNAGPRKGTVNITGGVMQVWDSFAIGNRVGTGTVNISGGVLALTGGTSAGNLYVGRGMDWGGQPGAGGPVALRVTGAASTIIGDGDFLMNVDGVASSSTLVAEITGPTHTTIKVTGNANITNGKLVVDLTGYAPVSGNSWTILQAGANITADKAAVAATVENAGFAPLVQAGAGSAGSLVGTFSNVDYSLAPLSAGLAWNISYANNAVVLSVTGSGPAYTADFNDDGRVDGADLAAWKTAYGPGAGADANGDNVSDGADFLEWQRQYGSGVPATPAVGAVPEPASIALCGLAAAALALRVRSRRA